MPLRVISGSAGGLLLQSPKRHPLRPTQDRIRQVIFSSLAEIVPGARVLDLYAGTGSLGIEALSRGAAAADFVEENLEAARCIRENLEHCKLKGTVHQSEVISWLDENRSEQYDIVLADPPYIKKVGSGQFDLPWAKIAKFLSPRGRVIWEHSSGREMKVLDGWEILRRRTYGETGLTFLKVLHNN